MDGWANRKTPAIVLQNAACTVASTPAALSDEDLMLAYQQGDEGAFERIYDRYERRLYNFLLRLTGDPDRARDLFQITFLSLHRNRGKYRPTGHFSSWFYKIAVNVARDEFRRTARRRETPLEPADPGAEWPAEERLACQADQDARVDEHELAEHVRRAVMALPPGQRVVILLSRYEDMSYSDIAEVLRISVNAVKQRAFEGLRSLGRKLEGCPWCSA